MELLDIIVAGRAAPVRKVAKLVGLVVSCQILHPQTLWFVAKLLPLFGKSDWNSSVILHTSDINRVFTWLHLVKNHPRRLWVPPPSRRYISSDATLSQLGAVFWDTGPSFLVSSAPSNPIAKASTTPNDVAINIAHFEAKAIPWACAAFKDLIRTADLITWAVDNQNVWYAFRSGFSRKSYIANEIDTLMQIVIAQKLWVDFHWIPSKVNLESDQLSRLLASRDELQLSNHYWQAFMRYCNKHQLPIPDIDGFATKSNRKCTSYCSLFRDSDSLGEFFGTQFGTDSVLWLFPPHSRPHLIQRVFTFIINQHLQAWFLLPRWSSRPWWTFTTEALSVFNIHPQLMYPVLTPPPGAPNHLSASNPTYPLDVWLFDFRH